MNIGPRKRPDAIAHRLRIAREDVETMRAKAAFIGNQGGPHPIFQKVAFQQSRVDLLEWAERASAGDINARRLKIEKQLGPAAELKGGSMIGVPNDVVTLIAHLELLEYSLGIHALQKGNL